MLHICDLCDLYRTYTMILLVKRPFHPTEAILVVIAHQWWNLLESGEIPLVRRQSLLRKKHIQISDFSWQISNLLPVSTHVCFRVFEIQQLYQNFWCLHAPFRGVFHSP